MDGDKKEAVKAVTNQKKKYFIIIDLALYLFIQLMALVYFSSSIWYLVGLKSIYFISAVDLLALLYLGFIIYFVVRSISHWQKRTTRKNILCLFLVMSLFLSVVVGFRYRIRPHVQTASGFLTKVQKNINIGEVQAWLAQQQIEEYTSVNVRETGFEVPDEIQKYFSNAYITIYNRDGGNKLHIGYGSGFIASWGLEIGPQSMYIPVTDESTYIVPICPGAYVWSDIG
jgi:predicted PurR-regulated permease PerM